MRTLVFVFVFVFFELWRMFTRSLEANITARPRVKAIFSTLFVSYSEVRILVGAMSVLTKGGASSSPLGSMGT